VLFRACGNSVRGVAGAKQVEVRRKELGTMNKFV